MAQPDVASAELSQINTTAGLVKNLSNRVKEKYASGIITIVIAAGLPLLEEFFVEAQYRCPCRTEQECNEERPSRQYAVMPVVMSTIVIFVLGFFANATIKCICKGDKLKHGLTRGDFWFWTIQAVVISLTWLCILTIDGDYFACIAECSAYNLTETITCESVELIADREELPFTDEYHDAKDRSQWAGYVVALVPLGLFMLISYTKFERGCCRKGCCECCCKCCCEFDTELSPAGKKELDKNMVEAVDGLKEFVISRTPALLEKCNIRIPETLQIRDTSA